MSSIPVFPITVTFYDYEGIHRNIYKTELEICEDLEYFNLEYNILDDYAVVVDAKGRKVILVVEHLEIVEFRLE